MCFQVERIGHRRLGRAQTLGLRPQLASSKDALLARDDQAFVLGETPLQLALQLLLARLLQHRQALQTRRVDAGQRGATRYDGARDEDQIGIVASSRTSLKRLPLIPVVI